MNQDVPLVRAAIRMPSLPYAKAWTHYNKEQFEKRQKWRMEIAGVTQVRTKVEGLDNVIFR